ncbi:MAG: hypothetical protein JW797_18830 [Bradymonadales bacterium]|nr:hypothetical protein [Bradymonadales bacterium]
MTVRLDHLDELDLAELFPDDELSGEAGDIRAPGRRGLCRIGQDTWLEYIEELRARGLLLKPDSPMLQWPIDRAGRYVVLYGVDLPPADTVGAAGAITHRQGGRLWGLLVDDSLLALQKKLREVQEGWGFAPKALLDVAGLVQGGAGQLAEGGEGRPATPFQAVAVKALRSPGQFAVFSLPEGDAHVPGLEMAAERLDALQRYGLPDKLTDPRQVIEGLLLSLKKDDYDLFCSLWIDGVHPTILKARFLQLKKNYEAVSGNISVGEYDSSYNLENYAQYGRVRIYMNRTFPGGASSQAPLWLVRQQDEWRLEKGTI